MSIGAPIETFAFMWGRDKGIGPVNSAIETFVIRKWQKNFPTSVCASRKAAQAVHRGNDSKDAYCLDKARSGKTRQKAPDDMSDDDRPEHDWRPRSFFGAVCARCGLSSMSLSLRNEKCLRDQEIAAHRAMRSMDRDRR